MYNDRIGCAACGDVFLPGAPTGHHANLCPGCAAAVATPREDAYGHPRDLAPPEPYQPVGRAADWVATARAADQPPLVAPIHPADLCDMLAEGCTLRIGHEGVCIPDEQFLAAQRAMTDHTLQPGVALAHHYGGAKVGSPAPGAGLVALARRGPVGQELARVASTLNDDQLATAVDLIREITSGATRVVVIGERVNDRRNDPQPSEPGHAELVDAGVWNPAARSVYGMEPRADGEANEFGEGASVQGYTEKERRAQTKAFLGVRRALVEMLDAPDPSAFFGKLKEAVCHVDPAGASKLLGKVERFMAPALPTNAPLGALPDADVDGEPEIGGES